MTRAGGCAVLVNADMLRTVIVSSWATVWTQILGNDGHKTYQHFGVENCWRCSGLPDLCARFTMGGACRGTAHCG